jgi:hypothetical protein
MLGTFIGVVISASAIGLTYGLSHYFQSKFIVKYDTGGTIGEALNETFTALQNNTLVNVTNFTGDI